MVFGGTDADQRDTWVIKGLYQDEKDKSVTIAQPLKVWDMGAEKKAREDKWMTQKVLKRFVQILYFRLAIGKRA